jgi:hypothetical protein
MIFSSHIFLLYFLPAFLLVYFLVPARWRNGVLLVASILFYAWGAPDFILILLASTVANFYLGNKVTALEHAKRAVEIDPGNEDYRRLLQQLRTGGDFYDRYAGGYTRSVNLNPLWLGLCAASLCTGGRCGFLPLVFCC